nr:nucleotide-binding alpha-beta plait domain-containing protein [Tanacetum cinerariifolium]
MGTYRSKEDDVAKISTTVYVTNFPESISTKELFHSCKVHGHVVDSFIPNKRAKNGKRFGFVHFINVFSDERLVNNLCTVWIDRYKLHANISRFHRNSGKGAKDENKGAGESMNAKNNSFSNEHVLPKGTGIYKEGNSYANVLKGDRLTGDEDVVKSPTGVLDDVCLMTRDLSNAILGRVNEFASLANLKMTLCNKGFVDIKIQYMGEFWVMMEFANKEMIKKFRDNVSVGSWFSIVKDATLDFQTKKRIAWVETEGIPFKLWTCYTFKRIVAKWGELLDVDDQEDSCFHSKRLCIHTKLERSISEEFKIIHRGKIYWIHAKETPGWVPDFAEESDDEDLDEVNSNDDVDKDQDPNLFGDDDDIEGVQENSFGEVEKGDNNLEEWEIKENAEYSYDPFNIYPMLNKKVEKGGCDNKSEGSLKYPPGFSPKECNEDNSVHVGADIHLNEDGNVSNKSERAEGIVNSRNNKDHMKSKDDSTDSVSLGHFKNLRHLELEDQF